MLLIELLVGAAGLVILAPALILSVEVLAGTFSDRHEATAGPAGARPRVVMLVPAHDEAPGIGDTVRSLLPQLHTGDRLLVVADNCTDDTAAKARAAGAEVIVRNEPTRRGKGYALDYGIRHLERDPPEVVLIVDADCRFAGDSFDRLAHVCAQMGRPVQALNLSYAPPGADLKMRIAEFASLLKNLIRPLGLRVLGLPCQLTGTGMAFPWVCIKTATLATGHVVEDLKLGLDLTRAGHPPLFCPGARVSSYFPATEEGFRSQRTRWEHGYLAVLLEAPAVLLQALRTVNGPLLALGLDLCVPPIALLTLLGGAVWVASAVLYATLGKEIPLLIASAAAALLALSVLLAWARHGREILSLGSLLLALAYALRKIPFYGRFLLTRQLNWVRTKRDPDRTA